MSNDIYLKFIYISAVSLDTYTVEGLTFNQLFSANKMQI